ncbi:P-loop containing nucleoside triphosphate hydrolase protein [Pisolithus marmoratus]|nr:P-loop containing nucleoside triphosphate hydrolase protein [Pisolithus marmoratus]
MAKEIRIACVEPVFSKCILPVDRGLYRVMGATGSGKTTFINRASGSDFPVESGLESCTTDVGTSKPFLLDGRFVTLIDTPGFDDTIRNDTDVLTSIAAYLSNTYEQGAKLAGIIYMHRISDIRMSGTSKRNFHIFRELCGESTLSNVLIVTNMWGNVDPKIGEERERELATSDKLFKPVLEKGAQLLRHDNTAASAHTILRNLINSQTATLAIQHEIVNQRKDLARTAAGAELTRLLKEQAERYGDEVRKLRGELELATRAKDEARKELQEEVEKKRGEIERIQRDVGRMATDFLVERARLESRIAEMEAENRRYLANMQDLRDQVNNSRKEVESMQIEHARRESELLAVQREEVECTTRLLVEERLARKQAEAQCSKVQANGAATEVERAPDKIQIEDAKAAANAAGGPEPHATIGGEDEDVRNFAEDVAFLVDFMAKTFLPKPLETRLKSLMAQAARTARESTTYGHKLISTYLSR